MPMPPAYGFFFNHKEGFYVFAIPWLAYAIHLIWRGTAKPRELVAFSSSLIMALLTLTILFGLALASPWIPWRVISISNNRGRLSLMSSGRSRFKLQIAKMLRRT
jgi:hypothetical protein